MKGTGMKSNPRPIFVVRFLLIAVFALFSGCHFMATEFRAKVVFNNDTQHVIVFIHADGSGAQILTDNGLDNSKPVWSPDGRKIAWVASNTIWTMDWDGGDQEQLISDSSDSPEWSPDGKKIAYVASNEIWTINADGTNAAQVSGGGTNSDPHWSPDGAHIAYLKELSEAEYDLYVDNQAITSPPNAVEGYDNLYAWSPDGGKIAYIHDDTLYVMDSHGNNYRQLTPPVSGIQCGCPVWSPNGHAIAYEYDTYGQTAIIVISSDGAHHVNVTDGTGWAQNPLWSPDGTKILYNSGGATNSEIFIGNADGSGSIQLTSNPGSNGNREASWTFR
jgi:TolB protein